MKKDHSKDPVVHVSFQWTVETHKNNLVITKSNVKYSSSAWEQRMVLYKSDQ